MAEELEREEEARHGPKIRELPEEGEGPLVPSTLAEESRRAETVQQQEQAAQNVTLNSGSYVRMRDTVTWLEE